MIAGGIDDMPPMPKPKPDDYGVGRDGNGHWLEDSPQTKRYRLAERAYFEQCTDGPIPAFKFSSNDGWWVRPEEIRHSLANYERPYAPQRESILAGLTDSEVYRLERFVEFLRQSITGDEGFEVA